ncbi:uncharacterized protein LOC124361371 [Homalodisca vitripennis]|uniref:uncharacterized protein LOC124361371 n=1 Tax=Homalodisca vitripennis TaxID=197043 RepID=UPI001EECA45C|nr:uncharacterized protein LOC124361371 [Homalodisca vitripennis]
MNQLSKIVERKEVTKTDALRIGSVIPDLLTPEMARDDLLVDLVSMLSQLPLKSFMDHKMCVFAVRNALVTIKRRDTVRVTVDVAVDSSSLLLTITRSLLDYTKRDHAPTYFTFSMMHQTISYLLDWVDVILDVKHEDMLLQRVEYTRPDLYFKMSRITKNVLASFKNIGRTLILRHLPSQTHRWIESTLGVISMWTKVDDPVSLSKFELGGKFEEIVPVAVSERLAKYAAAIHRDLGLSFVYLEKSPLWWHKGVNTINLDIHLCFKKSQRICNYPRFLPGPLRVAYNGTDVLITQIRNTTGVVHQFDHSNSIRNLDEELTIFKLHAPFKGRVYVDFQDGLHINKLLVQFRANYRPNYTSLSSKGVMVNSSLRNALTYDPEDEDHLHYMALMPLPQVSKSETVNFTARIYYKLCKTWSRGSWRSSGCKVSDRSTRERLVCECAHLSMFAAQLAVPYIREDTLQVLVLEPVQAGKILPVLILLSQLALYLVGCVFAWLVDRRDKAKRYVIVLEDNYPGDEAAYLRYVIVLEDNYPGDEAAYLRYVIVLEDNYPGDEAAYLRYVIVLEDNYPGDEAAYLRYVIVLEDNYPGDEAAYLRYVIVLEDNYPGDEAAYLRYVIVLEDNYPGDEAAYLRYVIVLEDNYPGDEAAYLRYVIVLEDNNPGDEAAYLRYVIVLEDNYPGDEAAYLRYVIVLEDNYPGDEAAYLRYVIVLEDNYPGDEAAYLRYVIVLEDNYPGDEAAYLVCVVTGARFSAGTTAIYDSVWLFSAT